MQYITSNKEYQEVYKNNLKYEGKFFVFLKKKISEDVLKIGIVVSKKVAKAVQRNKTKRRVKAFLRENEQLHPINSKLVIIAKPGSATADWNNIRADLRELFIKSNEDNE